MSNELYQHKKSDSIKWIITFVALILLAASVVALGAQVFGDGFMKIPTTETTPENKTEGTPVDPLEPIETDEIPVFMNGMTIVNSELMKLSASAPASYANKNQTSVELHATAYPIGSENGGFVWSAKWANANSTFAKGKDVYDYISMEGSDSNICTITALQPFGEQIVITVSTVYNPDATATCTVDYSQKFADSQYLETNTNNFFQTNKVHNNGEYYLNPIMSGTKEQLIDAYINSDNIDFSYITTDVYTMDMEQDDFYYVVTVSEEFYDILKNVGIEVEEWQSYTYFTELTPAQVLNSLCCGNIVPEDANDEVDYDLINKFNEAITQFDDLAVYIEVHAVSEYEEKVFYYNFIFDSQAVDMITTEVKLNQNGIIF